jgi:hypothetical protein
MKYPRVESILVVVNKPLENMPAVKKGVGFGYRGWIQGFGSGSVLDPDSIRSVDPVPDPYSESGFGSRRAKITYEVEIFLEISCFEVPDVLF